MALVHHSLLNVSLRKTQEFAFLGVNWTKWNLILMHGSTGIWRIFPIPVSAGINLLPGFLPGFESKKIQNVKSISWHYLKNSMKHKIFNETQNFNSHFFIIIIVNI